MYYERKNVSAADAHNEMNTFNVISLDKLL